MARSLNPSRRGTVKVGGNQDLSWDGVFSSKVSNGLVSQHRAGLRSRMMDDFLFLLALLIIKDVYFRFRFFKGNHLVLTLAAYFFGQMGGSHNFHRVYSMAVWWDEILDRFV